MKKNIFFEEIEGKNIFSILSEPENSPKKLVIMSHGFRSSSIGPNRTFVNFSKLLNSHGFSTLRFDQPGCGNSDGDFIDVSFREWVKVISYLAKKYIGKGYKITLLGQSMGATASLIAVNDPELKTKVPCAILWVPDPESDYSNTGDAISEESGEKYNMSFWREAKEMDFFKCLHQYQGGIHLVYGDRDRYVSKELREKTISAVESKKQKIMILKGQDHSPWEYDVAQKVFEEEINFLDGFFASK